MSEYQWRERRIYTDHAPKGMCYSVREMCSYGTSLDRFIPHLHKMAEGLSDPHFETYDRDPQSSYDDEDNYGMFVIGLRPMTADDVTADEAQRRRQEVMEREQLAYLKEKYGDA